MNEHYCVLLSSRIASGTLPHLPSICNLLESSWLWHGPTPSTSSLTTQGAQHRGGKMETLAELADAAELVRASIWVHDAHTHKGLASAFISVCCLPEAMGAPEYGPASDGAAVDFLEPWRPVASDSLPSFHMLLHQHEGSINTLLPRAKLQVQVSSPGFVTSTRFFDLSSDAGYAAAREGVCNIRMLLVPVAKPHKMRICLSSLIDIDSRLLHDRKIRHVSASSHAYMGLVTPERGALVHGQDRIGVLGRDSLGDKYILESALHQGSLESAVFGVEHPDLGQHLVLVGGGLPDGQGGGAGFKLDAHIWMFAGDRQLAHVDLKKLFSNGRLHDPSIQAGAASELGVDTSLKGRPAVGVGGLDDMVLVLAMHSDGVRFVNITPAAPPSQPARTTDDMPSPIKARLERGDDAGSFDSTFQHQTHSPTARGGLHEPLHPRTRNSSLTSGRTAGMRRPATAAPARREDDDEGEVADKQGRVLGARGFRPASAPPLPRAEGGEDSVDRDAERHDGGTGGTDRYDVLRSGPPTPRGQTNDLYRLEGDGAAAVEDKSLRQGGALEGGKGGGGGGGVADEVHWIADDHPDRQDSLALPPAQEGSADLFPQDTKRDDVSQLLQEGGLLLQRLSERDQEDVSRLIQRPSSPVAFALHSRIAESPIRSPGRDGGGEDDQHQHLLAPLTGHDRTEEAQSERARHSYEDSHPNDSMIGQDVSGHVARMLGLEE